jgi:hypothetical protein
MPQVHTFKRRADILMLGIIPFEKPHRWEMPTKRHPFIACLQRGDGVSDTLGTLQRSGEVDNKHTLVQTVAVIKRSTLDI